MYLSLYAGITTLGLFVLILLGLEGGRRFALRRQIHDAKGSHAGNGAVEGAVFGLLGLLMALTFTSAASRFDQRRQFIVDETTAFATACRQLDFLPAAQQEAAQAALKHYADLRIEFMQQDNIDYKAYAKKENEARDEIWKIVKIGVSSDECKARGEVLAAVNALLEIGNRRRASIRMHVPVVVFVLLFGMAIFGSVLAGYAMTTSTLRKPLHMLAFAAGLSLTIYVILDLEYPRSGIISLDGMETSLVRVRDEMDKPK